VHAPTAAAIISSVAPAARARFGPRSVEIAALLDEGKDRRDVGRELDLPLSRIVEARENILAGFLALPPPLAIRAVALRPILVLARPATGGDHFLGGAGSSGTVRATVGRDRSPAR
jgi:hypothetical protein